MTTTLVLALIASGVLGIVLAPAISRRPGLQAHSIAFAAGVLLTVVVTHVVPDALGDGHGYGAAIILVGFIGMMFLQQKVLKADPCCGHEHAKHAGVPAYLSMVACSINDGIILSDIPGPTNSLFWAMCGHKVTTSFALIMLLRETSSTLSPLMQTLGMVIFVAITPVVILASNSLEFLHPHMNYLVALGAGALLYVICGGLIPRVEHLAQDGRGKVLLTFLVGTALTIAVELIAPHHHGHGH